MVVRDELRHLLALVSIKLDLSPLRDAASGLSAKTPFSRYVINDRTLEDGGAFDLSYC